MIKLLYGFFVIMSVFPIGVTAQKKDITIDKPEVSEVKNYSVYNINNDTAAGNYDGMKLNVSSYYGLISDNFKKQVLFPFYLQKKDWLKVGTYALITAAVATANETVKQFSIGLAQKNQAVALASRYTTRFGNQYGIGTLAGLLTYSALFKKGKLKNTTLLASQAYFISNIIGGGAKILFSVQGPFYTDPITNKTGPIFYGPFYTLKKAPNGEKLKSRNYVSFPSGHTYSAFAIATVYAMEYKDKPLVPIFCYAAASLVGLSRLTENRHWAMDIIPGALLGYYSAKQVVKNYHRSSKKQRANRLQGSFSFNLQYINNQLIPGVLCRF